MQTRSRVVFGCAGVEPTQNERALFRDVGPWGFILFSRNVADCDQVRKLVSQLRETVGDPGAPVLIDQEGGRVARLKPPNWKPRPAAKRFGDLYERSRQEAVQAVYLNARLIANDLMQLGVNVNCTPVLDIPVEGADKVIGDRAFSRDPVTVTELGRAAISGFLDGGVLPVMKHVPGHGRANADSHLALPRVSAPLDRLRATDFAPFRSLHTAPVAMTAHVVYENIDAQRPATTSPGVIHRVIRSELGFDGLLLSDDLSMSALSGSLGERAKAALSAGCDIALHCNGSMDEMKDVAKEAKQLVDESLRRAERALSLLRPAKPFDVEAAERRVEFLVGSLA